MGTQMIPTRKKAKFVTSYSIFYGKGLRLMILLLAFISGHVVSFAQCPEAHLNGPKMICHGGQATLSATASKAGQGATITKYEWIWNGSSIAGAHDSTLQINKNGTYQVVVTNSNQCSVRSLEFIVAAAMPSMPVIAGDGYVCGTGSTFLNAEKSMFFGPATYQWQLNGSNIANENKSYLDATNPGVYTMVTTSFQGCVNTSNAITVVAKPTGSIAITGPSSYCSGTPPVLQANPNLAAGASIATYQWLLDGEIISGATNQSYQTLKDGKYSILAVLKSACTLSSPEFALVSNSSPLASIDGMPAYCHGATSELSAHVVGGTAPFVYQWFANGSPISGATNTNYTIQNKALISLEVRDAHACLSKSSAVQAEEFTIPKIKIIGSNAICTADYVQLSTAVSVNSGANTPVGYTWYLNGNEVTGERNAEIVATEAGMYHVEILFASGCMANAADFRVNNTKPQALITGNSSFCSSEGSTILSAASSSGLNGASIVSYQWKLNGANIQGAQSPTFTITDGGNYEVVVTDSNGCSAVSLAFAVQKNPC